MNKLVATIYKSSEIPGLFYTYKLNFRGGAFGVNLETNHMGFRGPNWHKVKEANVFRIALIGDSSAFGFGVNFEQTMGEVLSAILEKKYNRPVEVLNFGVNGYNSIQQKSSLENFAINYQPDIIILLPSGNDHKSALRADSDGWLHWDGNEANKKSRVADKSIPRTSWLLRKSRLFFYLKLVQKRLYFQGKTYAQAEPSTPSTGNWMGAFPPGPVSERLRTVVYQPLGEMLTTLKKHQIPAIIASVNFELDYRQMFQILQQEYNVPSLELLSLFPEADSWESLTAQFSLGWDNHLNAIAHERWAKALVNVIEEQELFPK